MLLKLKKIMRQSDQIELNCVTNLADTGRVQIKLSYALLMEVSHGLAELAKNAKDLNR